MKCKKSEEKNRSCMSWISLINRKLKKEEPRHNFWEKKNKMKDLNKLILNKTQYQLDSKGLF